MGSHTECPCTPGCSSSLCPVLAQRQPGSPSPVVQAEQASASSCLRPHCTTTRLLAELSLLFQLLDFAELQIAVIKPQTYFPFQGSDLNTQHPSLSPSHSTLPKAQLQLWRAQQVCQTWQPRMSFPDRVGRASGPFS